MGRGPVPKEGVEEKGEGLTGKGNSLSLGTRVSSPVLAAGTLGRPIDYTVPENTGSLPYCGHSRGPSPESSGWRDFDKRESPDWSRGWDPL